MYAAIVPWDTTGRGATLSHRGQLRVVEPVCRRTEQRV
jgi:hypothetical protein